MGNCCCPQDSGEHEPFSSRNSGSPARPVDRQQMLDAAERRMNEEANRGIKGEVRLPKQPSSDLPAGADQGPLKWQVG